MSHPLGDGRNRLPEAKGLLRDRPAHGARCYDHGGTKETAGAQPARENARFSEVVVVLDRGRVVEERS
jgi:hypothetical protein